MPTIPANPEDRKQLFARLNASPDEKKLRLYEALRRRCCYMVLQGWDQVRHHHPQNSDEKIRILLAYKSLDWVWFTSVPKLEDLSFTVFVREDRDDDEGPDDVNEAFEMSMEELKLLCQDIEKPDWAGKAKRISVSLRSFPHRAG